MKLEVIISVLAIIISLGSLGWNIAIYIKNERRKLKIEIYPDIDEDPSFMLEDGYTPTEIFVIKVTSFSKQSIRYYSPCLKYTDGVIQELENKPSSDNIISYGGVNYHIYLREHFINERDRIDFDYDDFKCIIQDTLGKKYESNLIVNENKSKFVLVEQI